MNENFFQANTYIQLSIVRLFNFKHGGTRNMKPLKATGLCMAFLLLGCNVSVNKGIDIPDGSKIHRDQNSVNGNIQIGSDCEIRGVCRSVNGSIEVGDHSKVRKLQSVNGGIRLMEGVEVRNEVEAVNGGVELDKGAKVYGDIKTVNGPIRLDSAMVFRDIVTYNGDITLDNGSLVKGDILIKQSKHGERHEAERRLTVEITNHSVVEGDVVANNPYLKVDVVLSNGGQLKGKTEKANLIVK
jgi:DUF4097 and DUF4098 domain-containing protein YvlB